MFNTRINQLQATLKRPILIKKKENLLYLTGRSFLHGYLLVKPLSSKRFLSSKASAKEEAFSPKVVFFGDGLESPPTGGEKIKSDRLKNLPLYLSKAASLELEDEFTFAEYNYIRAKCQELRAKIKIRHVKSPVDYLRTVKDRQEINLVKKSMQIVEKVFALVRKEIKRPGMTEIRLAEFIRQAGLKSGASDVSFSPIVASGANAAVPHHIPSNKKLKAGETIILDFGYKYKNYCSDFTRTVFLKFAPKKMAEAYNQVEKAYYGSIDAINIGAATDRPIKAENVYQRAVDVLAAKNLDKYFIHSLGHGTGLEIHELPNLSPRSRDVLQNGMVFSVEPGVYLPRLGGVRIEDLVYLEKGRVERFIAVPTKLKNNIF